MIMQVIGAFMAVVTVSVVFGVSKKFLLYTGFAGAFGWFIYLVLLLADMGELIAVFVATLASAFISHIFARILKAPVTTFLIPAILPTVPGVGMYRIVYYMILGDKAMTSHYFTHTLQVAGMIAIGIFVVDTLFRYEKFFWRRKEERKETK